MKRDWKFLAGLPLLLTGLPLSEGEMGEAQRGSPFSLSRVAQLPTSPHQLLALRLLHPIHELRARDFARSQPLEVRRHGFDVEPSGAARF